MDLLLDTQILIWFQLDAPQLPARLKSMIENPDNEIFVSHLSFMEIAIKQMENRLPELVVTLDELVEEVKEDGFAVLPISLLHIRTYPRVPFYADHRDPFDRLLLATALAERMPILSADARIQPIPRSCRSDLVVVFSTQRFSLIMDDVHTPGNRNVGHEPVRSGINST